MKKAALVGMLVLAGCGGSSASHAPPSRPVSSHASPPFTVPRPPATRVRVRLGHSYGGRPIVALRAGNPSGPPVLVFGCIHGTECAGMAVTRALEHVHTSADLWIVPNLNPDGYTRGIRQNGRGVDLNANWSSQWQGGGRPFDTYYPGPRPFSERESRIARNLILRIRPRVTIWFHQHMDLIWAYGPSSAAGREYARAVGMRFYLTTGSTEPPPIGRTTTCRTPPR